MKEKIVLKTEAIRLREEENLSLSEIRKITGLSKSTLSILLRDLPLAKEVISEKHSAAQAAKENLPPKEVDYSCYKVPLSEDLKSFQKGYVAEQFVKYLLMKQGLTCFDPPFQTESLDILVQGKSGKFYRCEVKATAVGATINLMKNKHNFEVGRSHIVPTKYTEEDNIDLFFAVDLQNELVCVIPSTWVYENNHFKVRVSPGTKVWQFINRFDLIE